jgi:hypothetical protein
MKSSWHDFSRKWNAMSDRTISNPTTSDPSTPDPKETLGSVATQLMSGDEVVVGAQRIRVKRVGSGRLRMAQFKLNGRMLEAIEQNPEKPSRWGQLARQKHQVVQFLDPETHRYVAVAVDGKVKEYGR